MPAYPNDSSAEIAASLGTLEAGTAVSGVAKALLEIFTRGDIEPGTRLPPERQLASTLGVGRSAVREALAALEILGIVHVRPGSGTYLRGSASELLPQTLSWGLMLDEPKTRELIDVRGALEIYAARLAATRMSDEELASLGARVEEMRASVDTLERFVEADLQFHLELARSTDNSVLLDLLQSIRSLLRVWVDRAVQEPAEALAAIEEHAAVHAAIATRDPDAAASAMALHMNTAARRLAGALE
ncbi:FadR/GntR family transcriptional regulator [Antiquaquibacter soli]|uniref:FadR/GntR family transcriptional regulator n=1 Tax=Antiquaquibacter soli TaxID=3064523 RepID=A0ABT9BMU2_9MICO|nr:FadR/GntR family transcriptional regulator [Protaetiibacter sp. WY-16]MDO7880735.1 FadR/GntR family transcriptional regulator [Protaetiibacter sp. WY-16]